MMIIMIIVIVTNDVCAWIAKIPGKPPALIAFARTSIKFANIPDETLIIAATNG